MLNRRSLVSYVKGIISRPWPAACVGDGTQYGKSSWHESDEYASGSPAASWASAYSLVDTLERRSTSQPALLGEKAKPRDAGGAGGGLTLWKTLVACRLLQNIDALLDLCVLDLGRNVLVQVVAPAVAAEADLRAGLEDGLDPEVVALNCTGVWWSVVSDLVGVTDKSFKSTRAYTCSM